MPNLNPVLTALVLVLGQAGAGAQEVPAPAPASALAVGAVSVPEGSRAPLARTPVRRRAVQQVIAPTPRIVTDAERPNALQRPPGAPQSSPPFAPAAPPPRINGCDAGGCLDTSGARYNGGVGNTLIGPQGQLCIKGVGNAQCF